MHFRSTVVMTLAVLLGAPGIALACSFPPSGPVQLSGFPAADAGDVPTDAVLVYGVRGEILQNASREVDDAVLASESGVITLTPRDAFGTLIEFVPDEPLSPQTRYTLQVRWSAESFVPADEVELSFTTGEGPTVVDASPPPASIAHFTNSLASSCSSMHSSCISLPDDDAMYVFQFVGDQHQGLTKGSLQINIFGEGQGHPWDCISLQRRMANGQLSDASTVCTADGLLYDVTPLVDPEEFSPPLTCDSHGLRWMDTPVGLHVKGESPTLLDPKAPVHHGDAQPLLTAVDMQTPDAEANGCSAAPAWQRTGPHPVAWLLLLVSGAALRRRRAR